MGGAPPPQSSNAAPVPTVVPVDFASLYKQEFGYAWRTLRRLGARERDLPDLAHDLFIVVYRHLADYDPSRPVRPWLFGIAFRVVSDYRRSARFSRETLDDAPDGADLSTPVDEQIAERQARAAVLRVLEELALDRRAVLVMHDIEGHPVPEIASALTIPVATAYSRLRLAREDVAAAIKRYRARERDAAHERFTRSLVARHRGLPRAGAPASRSAGARPGGRLGTPRGHARARRRTGRIGWRSATGGWARRRRRRGWRGHEAAGHALVEKDPDDAARRRRDRSGRPRSV